MIYTYKFNYKNINRHIIFDNNENTYHFDTNKNKKNIYILNKNYLILKINNKEIKYHTIDNGITYKHTNNNYLIACDTYNIIIYDDEIQKQNNKSNLKIKDKILFVMGNGPSLKNIMNNPKYLEILRNNHTFGLNAAYRAYDKYNFWPTYFGCFDHVVNKSHMKEFENLVLADNSIKEFYFIGDSSLKQNLYTKRVSQHIKFKKFNFINIPINKYTKISKDFNNYFNSGSSGANALQIGIMKGYKKIVLLGCDCNYVEKVEGANSYDKRYKNRLVISTDIKNNPNYWFSDYQKKGDQFNLPNTDIYQMGSWDNINKCCPEDVKIINCSLISKIPYFEKKEFLNL